MSAAQQQTPIVLRGTELGQLIQNDVKDRAARFAEKHGRKPGLVAVLVGDDPASGIYTRKKSETAGTLGLNGRVIHLPAKTDPDKVRDTIEELNRDDAVDGILLQRPLPDNGAGFSERNLVWWVDPLKDVDAFHPENVGLMHLGLPGLRPCTPAGVVRLLKHFKIEIAGRVACVVGRSAIVGKPMASLLLQENATVLHCHSQTKPLETITTTADILVVAAGKPALINAKHVKPGAVVVDVGIHRGRDGKICGDVDYESACTVASAITPVPGSVGPLTIAMLFSNTLDAAEKRAAVILRRKT